jgi:YfiH family protein
VHFPEQIHGAGVAVVTASNAVPPLTDRGVSGVDAIVTTLTRRPIGVLVADCMPVLLADPYARVVGAAHAGRHGLVAGVLQQTVAAMAALGALPARIAAVIGPSVCGRCYEVPAQLQGEVAAAVPGTAATTYHGTPSLDLSAGAVSVLRSAGLTTIEVLAVCTREDERFYSFRRSQDTGRFAGVVMLDGDE